MSEAGSPESRNLRIRTRLTERFNIAHPIVCAPMGLVTGGALAAAVSRAGGLGIVGGGYAVTLGGEPDLPAEFAKAQAEKSVWASLPGLWQKLRICCRKRCAIRHSVSFSPLVILGRSPRRLAIQRALLICQVQFLSQIDMALEAGAAVVVAQGTEAGGHAATRSTFPFVPEAADYLKRHSPETLLLAAGGIADGRGLAAALMLGADGVVVGSRFWSSAEALTPKPHTDKASAATGDSTVRTKTLDALRGTPWPREYSFRFLKNKLATEWSEREAEALRAFGTLSAKYAQARAQNDLDTVAVVCGEGVGLIKDRPPADDIVRSMITQAADLLRRGAGLGFT